MTINAIASDAIGLFLECLEDHVGVDHDIPAEDIERAKAMALTEITEGTRREQAMLDAFPALLAVYESSIAPVWKTTADTCECGDNCDGRDDAGNVCEHILAARAIAKVVNEQE